MVVNNRTEAARASAWLAREAFPKNDCGFSHARRLARLHLRKTAASVGALRKRLASPEVYQIQGAGNEVLNRCEKSASLEIRNNDNGLRVVFLERGFSELRVPDTFSWRRSWMSAAATNTKAHVLEHGFP